MSVKVGRVFGIPVEIHATWIIIFTLLTYTIGMGFVKVVHPRLSMPGALGVGALAAIGLFLCLMAHELAHALAAKRCGIHTGVITLFLLGGAAQLSKEPDTWNHELRIAIVGPLASLLLAFTFAAVYLAFPSDSVWHTIAFYLAFANALLGIVNLVPGYPLDGGRVLRAVLWRILNNRTAATRSATISGQAIGLMAAAYGTIILILNRDPGGIWLILIGWYVSDSAAKSWEQERLHSMLEGYPAVELITRRPPTLSPSDTVNTALTNGDGSDMLPVADQSGLVGVVKVSQAEAVPESDRNEKHIADLMAPADSRMIASAGDNAWSVVERLWDLRDDEAMVVEEGNNILGVVEKRELPALLTARLRMAAH